MESSYTNWESDRFVLQHQVCCWEVVKYQLHQQLQVIVESFAVWCLHELCSQWHSQIPGINNCFSVFLHWRGVLSWLLLHHFRPLCGVEGRSTSTDLVATVDNLRLWIGVRCSDMAFPEQPFQLEQIWDCYTGCSQPLGRGPVLGCWLLPHKAALFFILRNDCLDALLFTVFFFPRNKCWCFKKEEMMRQQKVSAKRKLHICVIMKIHMMCCVEFCTVSGLLSLSHTHTPPAGPHETVVQKWLGTNAWI